MILEEEPAALLVYGQVAELVDDEKSGLADAREFGRAGSPAGRRRRMSSPVAVKKRTGTPRSAGEPSDRDGEVALAGADGPVEHEVLSHPATKSRFSSCARPVGGHLQVGPVIAVEVFVGGEAGLFEQAQAAFGSLARVEFGREPSFDEVELVGRGLGERAGEHAACQVRLRLIFRMRSLFSVVDARLRRVSGITRIGSDAHRSSSVVRAGDEPVVAIRSASRSRRGIPTRRRACATRSG